MIDTTRFIEEAAALGAAVTPQQAELLARYCAQVVETNRHLNLTAITDPREVEVKHLLDCAAIAPLPVLAGRVADVGTGAGFPGVVLRVLRPDLEVTLVDATAKKLAFVQQACDALGIAVTTLHGRAEELARTQYREHFDTVTARAVAPLPSLAEYCLPLVQVGGYLVAMKGPEAEVELADSAYALAQLGGEPVDIVHFTLPGELRRAAVVLRKTAPTPPRYPRAGKNIAKAPLLAGK